MKTIFKEAHKMTREMVREHEVDYQAQFSLCLQFLLEERGVIENEEDLENEVLYIIEDSSLQSAEIFSFSVNKWENYGKKRIYIETNFEYNLRRGSLKYFIDFTNEENIIVRGQNGSASHIYNEIKSRVMNLVSENKQTIIEFFEETKIEDEKEEINEKEEIFKRILNIKVNERLVKVGVEDYLSKYYNKYKQYTNLEKEERMVTARPLLTKDFKNAETKNEKQAVAVTVEALRDLENTKKWENRNAEVDYIVA